MRIIFITFIRKFGGVRLLSTTFSSSEKTALSYGWNNKRKIGSVIVRLVEAKVTNVFTYSTEYIIALIWIRITLFFKTITNRRLGIRCAHDKNLQIVSHKASKQRKSLFRRLGLIKGLIIIHINNKSYIMSCICIFVWNRLHLQVYRKMAEFIFFAWENLDVKIIRRPKLSPTSIEKKITRF